jgi:hypothetical protein
VTPPQYEYAIETPPRGMLAIEALVAATCLGSELYASAIAILVGTRFPWASPGEVRAVVDHMTAAGRLIKLDGKYPKYTLAPPKLCQVGVKP